MHLPLPDSTNASVSTKDGKPTKDFYNWLKSLDTVLRQDEATLDRIVDEVENKPCFSAHKNNVDQTGVPSATFQRITWPSQDYNNGAFFSVDNWTPPKGKISLNAALFLTGSISSGQTMLLYVYKNGSPFKAGISFSTLNNSAGAVSIFDKTSGTDFYEIYVYQAGISGTATVSGNPGNSYFMGQWIGP